MMRHFIIAATFELGASSLLLWALSFEYMPNGSDTYLSDFYSFLEPVCFYGAIGVLVGSLARALFREKMIGQSSRSLRFHMALYCGLNLCISMLNIPLWMIEIFVLSGFPHTMIRSIVLFASCATAGGALNFWVDQIELGMRHRFQMSLGTAVVLFLAVSSVIFLFTPGVFENKLVWQ